MKWHLFETRDPSLAGVSLFNSDFSLRVIRQGKKNSVGGGRSLATPDKGRPLFGNKGGKEP